MKRSELIFNRPKDLVATAPAEAHNKSRDSGRLLVSTATGHKHARFLDLANFLKAGDLLVVNRSATLPASLPANGLQGEFTLNLSTHYGSDLWLGEPRYSPSSPGPISIEPGDEIEVAENSARFVTPFPGLPRLWFIQFSSEMQRVMQHAGRPIRYGYLDRSYGLQHYQTLFANTPGSAEMPSAAYPFTRRIVQRLQTRDVNIASILLHTGVSSLEVEVDDILQHPLYPEPYWVPAATAASVNQTRTTGGRIIALGTTVVRALESAWNGHQVCASSGFTRLYIHPERGVNTIDGLITGLHDPVTSHLAMLYAIGGKGLIRSAYVAAVHAKYQWHEFGDSHLILPSLQENTRDSKLTARYSQLSNPHIMVA